MAPSLKGRSQRKSTRPPGRDLRKLGDSKRTAADSDDHQPRPEMQCELKGLPAELSGSEMSSEVPEVKGQASSEMGQQNFLVNLYKFMKERGSPIERIPHLGFKQVNLWTLYKTVEKLGGYEAVTTSRLWKNIYDELGGNPGSTSAATCTRRHYERLVLPYERHIKGEEDKPLPAFKPRKQYNIKSKEEKGGSTELKDKNSKRKPLKECVKQSKETNGAFPQVDPGEAGREPNEQASMDKEPPSPSNTTPGSEDLADEPLTAANGPAIQDNSRSGSPVGEVERPTRNGSSKELQAANGPSPQEASRAATGSVAVVLNGHCATTDDAQGAAEEMVPERTTACEDSGTDPCQPGTVALPTRLAPEAGESQPPLLRSRRDQAIMSPLAKKKFLAQGSDSSFHAVGVPSSGVKSTKGSEVGHSLPASSCPPEASARRPSVIHHVQQPREAHPDYRSDWPYAHSLDKYQLYPFKPLRGAAVDCQGTREERDGKGRPTVHSQHPLCFGTFCCSPYVQGIIKPLLHYPNKGGPLSCCANQRGLREFSGSGALELLQRGRDQPSLASDGHKVARCYGRPLAPSDQPTDLSLPRGGGQRPAPAQAQAQAQPAWAPESKGGLSPLRRSSFSGRPPPPSSSSASEGHPKACWVPPISVALPRRVPAKRAKSDGPPPDAKGGPSPTSCRLAQAAPRSQKELDAAYGKKLRVVSPLLAAKDPVAKGDGKATGAEQKPAVPGWLPAALTPQAPASYEGARGRVPAAYALHSDHVKRPSLFSPFVPSLTLNSFMIPAVPGQVLSPPGHPLDLYKHLAAGTSYEHLLRHRLYPLTAWYPSPHLPSFQAGHKL